MKKIKVGPEETKNMPGQNEPDRRLNYLKEKYGIEIMDDWINELGLHKFKVKKVDEGTVQTVDGYSWYNLLKLYLPEDF